MNYTDEDLQTAFDTWRNTPITEFRLRQERWHIYCSIRDCKPLDYYQSKHDSKFTFQKLIPNKQDEKTWN